MTEPQIAPIRHLDPNDPQIELTLKEAIASSLLNQTHNRVTGAGGFGDVILDGKPSKVLSAGFLLPASRARRDEQDDIGQANDAVTPIHIATAGLAFQIGGSEGGAVRLRPYASIYVRILPTTQDILDDRHIAFRLSRDLQRQLAELRRAFIERAAETNANLLAREGRRSPEWRRIKADAVRAAREELERRIAQRVDEEPDLVGEQADTLQLVRDVAATGQELRGPAVALVEDLDVALLEEPELAQRDEDGEITEGGRLTVYPGMPDPPADDLVDPAQIPHKWRRLEVNFPALEVNLSSGAEDLAHKLEDYGFTLSNAIQQTIAAWEDDPDSESGGRRWACPAPDGHGGECVRPSQIVAWDRTIEQFADDPGLRHPRPDIRIALEIEITNDPIAPGQRTVRIILRNASQVLDPTTPRSRYFEHGIFQVQLECELPTSLHLPLRMERIRPSYRWNEWLLYPGLGVNSGINARQISDGRTVALETTYLPIYSLPRIEPFRIDPAPNFARLASDDGGLPILVHLASEYSSWISSVVRDEPWKRGFGSQLGPAELERERNEFERNVNEWNDELKRISKGIKVLEHAFAKRGAGYSDVHPEVLPLTAWRAMNATFALGKHEKWHLFQVAFILSHLPSFASRIPCWSERSDILTREEQLVDDSTATLLYFPTGGGKSEAFFGVLIFALFLDRLRGKSRGVTGLVRYPLRLLTAQQANRFAGVLAQAEKVRRQQKIEGEPFQIGFWVGSGNTPNNPFEEGFDDLPKWEDMRFDEDQVREESVGYRGVLRWKRLVSCPFCGSPKVGLRSRNEARTKRLVHVCCEPTCDWNRWHGGFEPLPFHVMDTDIYAYAPSILLGTVDKTAMIGHSALTIARVFGMFGFAPWQFVGTDSGGHAKPGYGRLFYPRNENQMRRGPEAHECRRLWPVYAQGEKIFYDPYPSLVVQDEAHLLEESLGTFSGLFETLFETALSELAPLLVNDVARIGDKSRRCKVIAASATVSEPLRQIRMLYQREVTIFPLSGPELYQSFFARLKAPSSVDVDRDAESNPEIRTPTQRIYASMPTNGKPHTSATVAILSAFHLAISEFFDWMLKPEEASRQVARARLLDNLPRDDWHRWRMDALNRATDDELCAAVDLHRIAICYVTTKKGGDNVKATLHEFTQRDHKRADLSFGDRGGIRTELITGAIDMDAIQKVVEVAKPDWRLNDVLDRNEDIFDALRGVVATSAISHGVDVAQFNTMFFAGLPADIAEYIQASSRVGRTHVGFSVLIPTPQTIRDVHVVEIHDIFHRFLERMVRPAPVDRWAEQAIVRVLSSALMIKACAVDHFQALAHATDGEKAAALPSDRISRVRSRYNDDPVRTVDSVGNYFRRGVGLDPARHLYWPAAAAWYDSELEDRTRRWVNEMGNPMFGTSGLRTFFENVGSPLPMTSLRDVDEAGIIKAAETRHQGLTRLSTREVRQLMRLLRQGGAAWGEGEDDLPDAPELEREEG